MLHLKVKMMRGETDTIDVEEGISVPGLKAALALKHGVEPVNRLRLIFRGKVLKAEHDLQHYSVESGHTLHCVVRPSDVPPSPPTAPAPSPPGAFAGVNASNFQTHTMPNDATVRSFHINAEAASADNITSIIGDMLNGIAGAGAEGSTGPLPTFQPHRVPTFAEWSAEQERSAVPPVATAPPADSTAPAANAATAGLRPPPSGSGSVPVHGPLSSRSAENARPSSNPSSPVTTPRHPGRLRRRIRFRRPWGLRAANRT
jgi:hypothetical protein